MSSIQICWKERLIWPSRGEKNATKTYNTIFQASEYDALRGTQPQNGCNKLIMELIEDKPKNNMFRHLGDLNDANILILYTLLAKQENHTGFIKVLIKTRLYFCLFVKFCVCKVKYAHLTKWI